MTRQITLTVTDDFYEYLSEAATEHMQMIEPFAARALAHGAFSHPLVHEAAKAEIITRLNEDNYNDTEIAERLMVTKRRINNYRADLGLPAVSRQVFDIGEVRRLWERGYNDREIAEALNCTQKTACRIRTDLQLPSNYHRKDVKSHAR